MKNYWKYTLTAAVACSFASAACGELSHFGFALVFGLWTFICVSITGALVVENLA